MEIVTLTIRQILTELPTLAVCFGAIIVAFYFWRRAPLSSLCIFLACGSTAAVLIFWPVAFYSVVALLGRDAHAINTADTGFRIFWSVIRAVATALLVFAVYAGRNRQPNDEAAAV